MDNRFFVECKESGHRCLSSTLDGAITHAYIRAYSYLEESCVSDNHGIIGIYYPPCFNGGEYLCAAFHWKRKRNERRNNHGI